MVFFPTLLTSLEQQRIDIDLIGYLRSFMFYHLSPCLTQV